MPDFDWNVRSLTRSMPDTPVPGAASGSPTGEPAPEETARGGGDTHNVHQHATTISLHPGLRLVIEDNLRGAAVDAHNLCVVVGTAKRECWKDGTERTIQTPFGSTQATFRLDVQEVVGDESGAALSSYSMPLNMSSRLLETGVLIDGQRVAVSGPLRLERTYDRQFASDDLDPGLPVWDIRLDAITVQAVTTDTSDGSWVQLEGEVSGDPMIRFRPIGPREVVPFASVRLRYRRPLRGAFVRSRAVYSNSVLIPLEVPLDGVVEQAGALLKNGNIVRIEGRLAPYEIRRRLADQQRPPAPQRSTPQRVAEALARLETQMRAQGGAQLERRIRAAKQRMLTIVQRAVSVGYVELHCGTPLTDDEIAALVATRPRRAPRPRGNDRFVEPEDAEVRTALDEATSAASSALLASDDEPPAAMAETPPRPRPRRRSRDQAVDTETGSGADET
jgi:hypothetical protein